MKRTKLTEIINWYNSKDRKPLVVWGARQVGKTYLIKELFAKEYVQDFIYLDLIENDEARSYFSTTCDPTKYIDYLETTYGKHIDSNTLLIFDEMQSCLNVFTSLKYFKQNYKDIPVIAAGSMVRLALGEKQKKNDNFLYPVGAYTSIDIFPMNYEEFLLNTNEILLNKIKEAFKNKQPLNDIDHSLAFESLYEYLSVGGMPEVLNSYLEDKSYANTNIKLKELYENYLGDMSQYNVSKETIVKTRKVYENIYNQLNKENKNFKIREIEKGKSNRDYSNAYYWLEKANVIYKCHYKDNKVNYPLYEDEGGLFRLYLSDVGLFLSQSGNNQKNIFIKEKRNELSGIFFENYVALELVNKKIDLYYWCGKRDHEFEFIVNYNGMIIPIDVKKSVGKLNSLEEYRMHNGFVPAIKISTNNYGYDPRNKILTIPLYMSFLLADAIKKQDDNLF